MAALQALDFSDLSVAFETLGRISLFSATLKSEVLKTLIELNWFI